MDQNAPVLQRILDVTFETLRLLVDHPDELNIEAIPRSGNAMLIRVSSAESDKGKLIGTQGRNARSLRILILAMASRIDMRFTFEIVDHID